MCIYNDSTSLPGTVALQSLNQIFHFLLSFFFALLLTINSGGRGRTRGALPVGEVVGELSVRYQERMV